MKRITPIKIRLFAAAFAALGSLATAQAGSFFANFDDPLPAQAQAPYGPLGSAVVAPSGGPDINTPACLQLTTTVASQVGVFIINDLDPGNLAVSFTASFKMTVGANGGDGFSFNFANNLDLTGNWGAAEEGNGAGLSVEFDTYYNGAGDKGASIDVKIGGTEIVTAFAPQLITTTGNYVDVTIALNPDKTLSVTYDGIYAYKNLDVSAALTGAGFPWTGALFGIGARNGSVVANKWIDDLSINTRTSAAAFVSTFAPAGRWVQPSSAAIDIKIDTHSTAVTAGGITLKLDGTTVTPTSVTVTPNDNTRIQYTPVKPLDAFSSHSVKLVFVDSASNPNTLEYGFSIPATDYTTLFTDGFESYTAAANPLDMNYDAGANASANGNLAGNPWFGPAPPNGRVVTTEGGVLPHTGNNMVRGSAPNDLDENWINLPYRTHGGNVYTGNIMMDWWFYDPLGAGGSDYRDFGAIGYYNTCPTTTDYPGTGSLNGSGSIQRLSLGAASNQGAGFDSAFYQARVVEFSGTQDGYAAGWFNTPTPRSIGWHHARIIVGPSIGADLSTSVNYATYFIDDMTNPTFSHVDPLAYGYNVLEINLNYGPTAGYYDDVSFAVGRPPKITVALSGINAVMTWPGLDFVLQSASSLTSPITWTDVTSATSPYSYDTTTSPQQYFRLRNY